MVRSACLLSAFASSLLLAGCQPERGSDAPTPAETPTPPAVVEVSTELPAEELTEPVEPETVAAEIETAAPDKDHDHDHHDHAEDEDEHDHDHAHGEAHVHGLAELSVVVEGDSLALSLVSPLANFGLSESSADVADPETYAQGFARLEGGESCSLDMENVQIERKGDHGSMIVDLGYTCADITGLSAVIVTAFENYSGFEKIETIVLNGQDQTATTLTAAKNRIALN